MKLKKLASLCLSAVLVLGVLSGCTKEADVNQGSNAGTASDTGNAGNEDYTLKIAYNNSLCEAPIQMGVEKGFFEAEGLKFEMVKVDAAHMPEAIGSGQIDAGFGLLGKYLQPIDNGLDIKITAGIHTGCIKVLVPQNSPIKTVSDLKGKKIGTTGLGAAAPTIITRRSLYHAGLNAAPDNCDAEFVVYSGSDLAQALANGAVDAIANGDPQASLSEKEYNLRPIIDTATDDEYKNEYCCISFVTGDIAKNHPEIADKFTRAIMKASQWVEENKEETAKIQIEKEWVAGDASFNASVLSNYSYKPSVNGGYEALQITVPDLQAIGLINADRDPQEFIDSITYKSDNLSDEDILKTAAEGETQVSTEDCCEPVSEVTPDCCETTTNIVPPDCCS